MPFAVSGLVITGMAGALGATVRIKVAKAAPLTLAAAMVTVLVAATVGVPLMTPVDEEVDRPAGRPVAAKPVGCWVPVIV